MTLAVPGSARHALVVMVCSGVGTNVRAEIGDEDHRSELTVAGTHTHSPEPSREGTHLPALLIVGQIAVAREASCSELLAWVGVLRTL